MLAADVRGYTLGETNKDTHQLRRERTPGGAQGHGQEKRLGLCDGWKETEAIQFALSCVLPSTFILSLRVLPPSSPSEFSPTSAWCSPSLPSLWWSLLVNPLVQFSTPSSILLLTVPVWSRHFPEFTPCRQFVTLVPPFDCPSLSHQSPAQSEVISRLVSVLSSLSAQPASPLHCACPPLLTRHAHTHRWQSWTDFNRHKAHCADCAMLTQEASM